MRGSVDWGLRSETGPLLGGWGSLMLEGWIIEGRARLVCDTHARGSKRGIDGGWITLISLVKGGVSPLDSFNPLT